MAAKKPKQTPKQDEGVPITPGEAARHLAAQISAASAQAGGSEDEPAEKLVIRVPLNIVRAVEKLGADANRSRNWMFVQLAIAGLDGVLAALPEDKRDAVLVASMGVE